MKNLLLLLLCGFALNVAASDVLQLTNGQIFQGTILKINKCNLSFEIDDIVYTIPASDISYVEFEKISKRRANKVTRIIENEDNCYKGTMDGKMHGHKGGQFCAGFFGGLIGLGIVAIVDRSPSNSKNMMLVMDNKDLWNDHTYLNCYEKQSKKEAIKMAGAGTLTWLILLVLSY